MCFMESILVWLITMNEVALESNHAEENVKYYIAQKLEVFGSILRQKVIRFKF